MAKYAKKRSATTSYKRLEHRIRITLDSTLREILKLPPKEGLTNPKPIPLKNCVEYLETIINGN